MSMLRRCTLGVLVLAVLLTAATARAQVLKQVPAKAFIVIKFNNLQALSDKVGAFATKL